MLLTACGGSRSGTDRPIGTTTGLARLDAAISGFDQARTEVLAGTGALVAAALALDAADAACSTGDRSAARAARSRARDTVPRAKAALAALPTRLAAYDKGASELAAAAKAATSLDAGQRSAVQQVVTAAKAEGAAADAFRIAGKTAWPAYAALDEAQATWLTRSSAGWYRTKKEGADAYAVFVQDQQAALTQARTLLRRVDEARRPVSDRVQAALRAADAALAPLRAPELPGG